MEKRLSTSFKVIDEVTAAADAAIGRVEGPASATHQFDLALYLRGVNALKAVRLLTGEAHWEIAAGPARQLFELVLAAEELNRAADREHAAARFAAFGLLQETRAALARLEYDAGTGRPVDAERGAFLVSLLEGAVFAEFRSIKNDGSVRWATTWAGKTARQLAASSSMPIRKHQYELLFSAWSEDAHAAPGALVDAIFRSADQDWVQKVVAEDERNVAEVNLMSMMLFFELIGLLPDAPDLGADRVLTWLNRVRSWTVERFGIDDAGTAAAFG